MSREQKRKAIKMAKKKGIPKSIVELYFNIKLHGSPPQQFNEGDKVKLDIEAIKKHSDYSKLTERYRNFVNDHVDDIFTIVCDKGRQNTNTLVCLAEDPDKWLFWTGNLKLVERGDKDAQEN